MSDKVYTQAEAQVQAETIKDYAEQILTLIAQNNAQVDILFDQGRKIKQLEASNEDFEYLVTEKTKAIWGKDEEIEALKELGVDYCKTIRELEAKIESDRIAMAALLEEARDQAREAAMAESRRKAACRHWKFQVDELTEQLKKRKTQLYNVIYGNPQATIDLVDEVRKGFTDVI